MTRAEAIERLQRAPEVSFDDLDEIFACFGFVSASPSFELEIYYHPQFRRCGAFPARDDGLHVLTPLQRTLALQIIHCVVSSEGR
jgi:hypothetical protein